MKKWIKGVVLTSVIVGSTFGVAYHMGFQYKIPSYTNHVLKQNIDLSNYERELSLSLSFDEKQSPNQEEPFSKIDGSVLVIHESKSETEHLIDYSLTSQGEEFSGKELYQTNDLVVKSPMYHRYIDFYDTPFVEEQKGDLSYLKESLFGFLNDSYSKSTLYRDIGGNEKGVKTLVIKGENEAIQSTLKEISSRISEGIPYQSVLLNNERITNRLLKEHLSDEEINQKFKDTMDSLENNVDSVVSHSKVTDSEIAIKITDKRIVKEVNIIIKMVYTNPETNESIPFTLYADVSTWNVDKAQLEEILIDPTNSIPYERMTDEIDYFEDENLHEEENALEDEAHVQQGIPESNNQGIQENTSTLKEIEKDFIPVVPDKE